MSEARPPGHPSSWRAIVKLDPARLLDDARLDLVAAARPDAVIVGGTQDVDARSVEALLTRLQPLRRAGVPVAYEPAELVPADPRHIDWLLVPVVLNAAHGEWLVRRHARAILCFEHLLDLVDWSRVIPVAYLVQNPHSAVGQLTDAEPLGPREAAALALVAERIWSFPVVYLEWSGRFGDSALVAAVAARLERARLFYGGGITRPAQARAMRAAGAAAVVIGNLLYTPQFHALPAILQAARAT